MLGKNKETAEQKLLKMIEASSGASSEKAAKEKASQKKSMVGFLKLFGNLLIAGVIVAIVFLVTEIKNGMAMLDKSIKFEVEHKLTRRTTNSEDLIPMVQKPSYYLASIKQRNIFIPFEAVVANKSIPAGDNRRIVQQTANLRLVGISWLDSIDSASAMIEDKEKKLTYFVRVGEKIGDVFIKTIYADSVKLGLENEEIIIKYDKSQM